MIDARAEADNIVQEFHEAGFPDCTPDTVVPGLEDALVATLTAAMRNHGAHQHHGLCESFGTEDETMCDCGTSELQEALSTLRSIMEQT